jgi:biopolymer transport protein ExbB
MQFLVEAMQKGGVFMWPILLAAIFALSISLERLYAVGVRANINASAFMAQVQKLILFDQIDRAIRLCSGEPYAMLPRVVKAGLTRADGAEDEIRDAVEESVLEVGPILNKRAIHLPMLANVATLIGLLGTIQGLILAFDAVANASAEAKQQLLADGIATAMYTTAFGLIVAVPTLVAHSLIQAQIFRIQDDVDQFALRTVNLLVARRRGLRTSEPRAAAG